MGALGFQDLVQQNLRKIGQSIQIVENKLLEVLMLLHWEKGSGEEAKERSSWVSSTRPRWGIPHGSDLSTRY